MALHTLRTGFRRPLVVVKHTPYESYKQLKAQGKAPLALRWERLKNRFIVHKECVAAVKKALERHDLQYSIIGREELDRQHIEKVDLVIAVGGDGTVLSASHFLGDDIPLLGVNSDPTREGETSMTKRADERRSFGALCGASAEDLEERVAQVLEGQVMPQRRTRLQTTIKSTFTELKLPPSLNDVLLAHPSPAAVSRFRLGFVNAESGLEHFSFNVWSSGIWISTATGSSAVMKAAGGVEMDPNSSDTQYLIREHLVEQGREHLRSEGHGLVRSDSKICIRWTSQRGAVYVDGEHVRHELHLGDELELSPSAPPLYLFAREDLLPNNGSAHHPDVTTPYSDLAPAGAGGSHGGGASSGATGSPGAAPATATTGPRDSIVGIGGGGGQGGPGRDDGGGGAGERGSSGGLYRGGRRRRGPGPGRQRPENDAAERLAAVTRKEKLRGEGVRVGWGPDLMDEVVDLQYGDEEERGQGVGRGGSGEGGGGGGAGS